MERMCREILSLKDAQSSRTQGASEDLRTDGARSQAQETGIGRRVRISRQNGRGDDDEDDDPIQDEICHYSGNKPVLEGLSRH